MKTVPETQEDEEAGSAQDDDADIESLLRESELSAKHDESQDLFGAEEKVHQQPSRMIKRRVRVRDDLTDTIMSPQ